SPSFASASRRDVMPMTTIVAATAAATRPANASLRRDRTGGAGSGCMRFPNPGGSVRGLAPPAVAVKDTEDDRDEYQCRHCSKNQTADNGAAERRVLLTAFAEPKRHRRHADDHGERGHQHRTEADETCLERRRDRVAALFELLAGKADDEDAVGGCDAHAHD